MPATLRRTREAARETSASLAGLPGFVRRGFHRPVYGPLQAGTYDLEVKAKGYAPRVLKRVEIVARQVAGPLTVALDRER